MNNEPRHGGGEVLDPRQVTRTKSPHAMPCKARNRGAIRHETATSFTPSYGTQLPIYQSLTKSQVRPVQPGTHLVLAVSCRGLQEKR